MKTRKYEVVMRSGISVNIESSMTTLDGFQRMIQDQRMRGVWAEFDLQDEKRILRVDPDELVGFYAEKEDEPSSAEKIG